MDHTLGFPCVCLAATCLALIPARRHVMRRKKLLIIQECHCGS